MKRWITMLCAATSLLFGGCSVLQNPGTMVAASLIGAGAGLWSAAANAKVADSQVRLAQANLANTELQRKQNEEAWLKAKAEREEACFQYVAQRHTFETSLCKGISRPVTCELVYASMGSRTPRVCAAPLRTVGLRL